MGLIGTFLAEHGPAARRSGTLHIGSTASGGELALPYVAVRGAKPGRTLWLNGQVHGDELNGMVAALQFINSLDPAQLMGNVVVTPTGNPQAVDQRRKRNAFDDLDLDQTELRVRPAIRRSGERFTSPRSRPRMRGMLAIIRIEMPSRMGVPLA